MRKVQQVDALVAAIGLIGFFCVAATLYRDPSKDMPGTDYGLLPTNQPVVGDVLTMGPDGTSWTRLTNFFRVWSGTTGNALLGLGTTTFLSPNNTSATLSLSDVAAGTRTPLTRATTLQNLYIVVAPAPGVGKSTVVSITTNGVASSIVATVTGTATNANDTARAITVPAGTEIGIRITTTSASVAGRVGWAFEGR